MSEEDLRREAVRRRLAGEDPEKIAVALGRTGRWVRKWVARHEEDGARDGWAKGRSRTPHTSPTRIPDELHRQILAEHERPHQIDLVGPRHLYGGAEFHALNLIDIGAHEAASEVLEVVRGGSSPSAAGLALVMTGKLGDRRERDLSISPSGRIGQEPPRLVIAVAKHLDGGDAPPVPRAERPAHLIHVLDKRKQESEIDEMTFGPTTPVLGRGNRLDQYRAGEAWTRYVRFAAGPGDGDGLGSIERKGAPADRHGLCAPRRP